MRNQREKCRCILIERTFSRPKNLDRAIYTAVSLANILINRPSDRFLTINLESHHFPFKKRYQSTRYRFSVSSQIYVSIRRRVFLVAECIQKKKKEKIMHYPVSKGDDRVEENRG